MKSEMWNNCALGFAKALHKVKEMVELGRFGSYFWEGGFCGEDGGYWDPLLLYTKVGPTKWLKRKVVRVC